MIKSLWLMALALLTAAPAAHAGYVYDFRTPSTYFDIHLQFEAPSLALEFDDVPLLVATSSRSAAIVGFALHGTSSSCKGMISGPCFLIEFDDSMSSMAGGPGFGLPFQAAVGTYANSYGSLSITDQAQVPEPTSTLLVAAAAAAAGLGRRQYRRAPRQACI